VLREAAEYPNSFIELRTGQERIETERYTLCMERAVTASTVQRQRFGADELDDVLAEIRSQLRARGRTSTQWEVGSRAQPSDLVSMLLERGLVRDQDPRAVALVLTTAPPPVGDPLIARRVQTFAEFAAAKEVQFVAFDVPPGRIADERAALAQEWDTGPRLTHAVWLGDEIVCAGTCAPTPHGLALFGGATLPQARGRGAYRALIRARWDEAKGLGQAALLTQAGSMSRPILERLGFEPVGYIEMLIDEFGDRP
jgi:GNAT superfamily N-acetyltransferase